MNANTTLGRSGDPDLALNEAYAKVLAFSLPKIGSLSLSAEQATRFAEQEAAFQTISIDEHGLSGGMRLNLLQPVHELAAEWRSCMSDFEVAIQPKMADIRAVEKLEKEAADEIIHRDEALEAVERELRQNPRYEQINEHHSRSKMLFDQFRDKHNNRSAVMFAKNPFYWVLMILVLLTECFINYHSFNAFWGVPAVALGTTVILGVLLALAAHGHGEILKQWSFRFGPQRDPAMRWTDWRMLTMSTGALFIVLGFTGWARWAAAMDTLGDQGQVSALGNLGLVQVDPLRDVMISLIANIGAWMVGVILSYLAHDHDPEYMAATKQFSSARRAWNHARKAHSTRLKHIEARHARVIEEKTATANSRLRAVTREKDMLKQVSDRSRAVFAELEGILTRNVEVYRDALVRITLSRSGQVQIIRAETNSPFSPFDYKAMKIAPAQIMPQVAA